ncbi:MAG: hypothetical protein ACRDK8_15965, partial [Solirubrobacteraceae bacterium]
PLLVRHLPALTLAQLLNLAVALRDRTLGVWSRAMRDALRGLPRVVRARRAVQRHRRVDNCRIEAVIGPPERL